MPAYVRDANANSVREAIVASMMAETGGTAEALPARSVLRGAGDITASVLILNGAKDERTDPEQARSLADAITRGGGRARAIIYPDVGHSIPLEVRNKDVDPFIDAVLGAGHRR